MGRSFGYKKTCPSHCKLLGQDEYQPAVPPGLTSCTSSLRILSYADFCSRRVAPSHILRINPVLIALESPFNLICFTVIPPSTALWKIGIRFTYSFSSVFSYYMPGKANCQYKFRCKHFICSYNRCIMWA